MTANSKKLIAGKIVDTGIKTSLDDLSFQDAIKTIKEIEQKFMVEGNVYKIHFGRVTSESEPTLYVQEYLKSA